MQDVATSHRDPDPTTPRSAPPHGASLRPAVLVVWPCIAIIAALLLATVVGIVLPVRDGPPAVARVFGPYLVLAFVAAAPMLFLARGRERRMLAVLVVLGLGVTLLRYPPIGHTTVRAADPTATPVTVATWNLEFGQVASDDVARMLTEHAPDIVSLQELTPDLAAAIDADPVIRARYPWRVLEPSTSWDGMGLLSIWPIEDPVTDSDPPLISAMVLLPDGQRIRTLAVHAPPPRWGPSPVSLVAYESGRRDGALQRLRARIEPDLAAGTPLLLLGDLNLTDREIAYEDLTPGLIDAHHAVGTGMGNTWRPFTMEVIPAGLLRIDHVLTANDLEPLWIAPDCTPVGSDHCLVVAGLELGEPRDRGVASTAAMGSA
ncbi:MAG: endonuclease/exonuclease/phosphatase family protein [Chloroflexi bacterium]|nr:endonuclease/exonuclease/phosphatase family protein [Chloroflexota bacterium]